MPGWIRFDRLVKAEREEIIAECALTPSERAVFEARADGSSIIKASIELGMSEPTVKRESARVCAKIARARHRRRGAQEQTQDKAI